MGKQILWWTADRPRRYFLLRDDMPMVDGDLPVRTGEMSRSVSAAWIDCFEIGAAEGERIAVMELGLVLDQLKVGIDDRLDAIRTTLDAARHAPVAPESRITPDAVPALWALVRALPGVIVGGLSGDAVRVAEANGRMADLGWRLQDAGIPVDERFAHFPDRLATLREEVRRRD